MQGQGSVVNFVGNTVVVSGSGAGLFVYIGDPAPGNPPVIWDTESTTDPYGNILPFTGAGFRNGSMLTRINGSVIEMGDATNSALAQMNDNGSGILSLASASVTGADAPGTIALISASASATGAPQVLVSNALIATSGTTVNPTLVTTDTWHSLGTLAGYTVNSARYRLTAFNEVEFDINVTGTGANATSVTFSVTLPAAYRPASLSHTDPLATNLTIAAMTTMPRAGITTAGAVVIAGTANIANTISYVGTFTMPLD